MPHHDELTFALAFAGYLLLGADFALQEPQFGPPGGRGGRGFGGGGRRGRDRDRGGNAAESQDRGT